MEEDEQMSKKMKKEEVENLFLEIKNSFEKGFNNPILPVWFSFLKDFINYFEKKISKNDFFQIFESVFIPEFPVFYDYFKNLIVSTPPPTYRYNIENTTYYIKRHGRFFSSVNKNYSFGDKTIIELIMKNVNDFIHITYYPLSQTEPIFIYIQEIIKHGKKINVISFDWVEYVLLISDHVIKQHHPINMEIDESDYRRKQSQVNYYNAKKEFKEAILSWLPNYDKDTSNWDPHINNIYIIE